MPCGSVEDMRSSLDDERMQLTDNPDDFCWGRWEWCQPTALPMPFFHAFACPVWETDDDYEQEGVGFLIERRKKRRRGEPYIPPVLGTEKNEYRPARTSAFDGTDFVGSREVWQNGLPADQRVYGDQAPLCGGWSWDSEFALTIGSEVEVSLIVRKDDVDVAVVPALNFLSCVGIILTVDADLPNSEVEVKVCVDDAAALVRTVTDDATIEAVLLESYSHRTTDVPDASFGLYTEFRLDADDSPDPNQNVTVATTYVRWEDAVYDTRRPRMWYQIHSHSVTNVYLQVQVDESTEAVMLGFFGVAAVLRQTADIASGLVALGLFSGTPTLAASKIADLPTATNGYSVLGSNHSITSSNGTYEDTGLSVTLPTAGTYEIAYHALTSVQFSTGALGGSITLRLRDDTAGADVSDSTMIVNYVPAPGAVNLECGSNSVIYTVTEETVIKLRAASGLATAWTVRDVVSTTKLTYKKLAV